MQPPKNVLDYLADCAEQAGEAFPGKIKARLWNPGAHGPSSTTALIAGLVDGRDVKITAEVMLS